MLPAALLVCFRPNMVQLFAVVDSIEMHRVAGHIAMVEREDVLRKGLRAIKFIYQLYSFSSRRAEAGPAALNGCDDVGEAISPLRSEVRGLMARARELVRRVSGKGMRRDTVTKLAGGSPLASCRGLAVLTCST